VPWARFDRSRWDDIRIVRWAILPTILLALIVLPPRVAAGNTDIPGARQERTVANFADDHCLNTPGPHHFILCRQRVSFTTHDGGEITGAVTVTQKFFEDHLTGMPIFYDRANPTRIRPTDSPGFWWFFLDGVVKVGIRTVPSVFLAFALGIGLARLMRLKRSLGEPGQG
jgi:hypothetical protein